MPHSRDRRVGRCRHRRRSALPCIAGALRRSLLASAASAAPRSVRRLPGPFPIVVVPARTSRRVSVPTCDGYSSRSQPVLRDVAGVWAGPRTRQAPGGAGSWPGAADAPAAAGSADSAGPFANVRTGGTSCRGSSGRPRACRHVAHSPAARDGVARSSPATADEVAERVGFEPTKSFDSALFKSAAINRSATSPDAQDTSEPASIAARSLRPWLARSTARAARSRSADPPTDDRQPHHRAEHLEADDDDQEQAGTERTSPARPIRSLGERGEHGRARPEHARSRRPCRSMPRQSPHPAGPGRPAHPRRRRRRRARRTIAAIGGRRDPEVGVPRYAAPWQPPWRPAAASAPRSGCGGGGRGDPARGDGGRRGAASAWAWAWAPGWAWASAWPGCRGGRRRRGRAGVGDLGLDRDHRPCRVVEAVLAVLRPPGVRRPGVLPTFVPRRRSRSGPGLGPRLRRSPPFAARMVTVVDPLFETTHGPLGASMIEMVLHVEGARDVDGTHPRSSSPEGPPMFRKVTVMTVLSPSSRNRASAMTRQPWAPARVRDERGDEGATATSTRGGGSAATHQATWWYGVHSRIGWTSAPGRGAFGAVSIPVTNASTSARRAGCRRHPRVDGAPRERERLAIRPCRGHGREGVADGEDPGDERDLLTHEAIEVALAVPALVVVTDPGPDDLDVGQVAHDQVAERDVLLDHVVLVRAERAGLAQDVVRDADLADVVEQTGDADGVDEVALEPETFGQEHAVAGDVLGVLLRVAVLGVDREDQPLEDVERASLRCGLARRSRRRGWRRRRSSWPPGASWRRW